VVIPPEPSFVLTLTRHQHTAGGSAHRVRTTRVEPRSTVNPSKATCRPSARATSGSGGRKSW